MASNSSPRIPGRLGTVARLVRERQWEALRANLERNALPRWLFYTRRLAFCRLDEVKRAARVVPGFEVRLARPEDEPLLRQVRDHRRGFRHMFERGDLCVLCTARDRGVAFFWVERQRLHVSRPNGYEFELEPGTGWSYAVEIHPEYRLRGAFTRLWGDGFDLVRGAGIHALYTSMPEDENAISMRSHVHVGFRPFCRFEIRRRLGRAQWHVRFIGGPEEKGSGVWRGVYREPGPLDVP